MIDMLEYRRTVVGVVLTSLLTLLTLHSLQPSSRGLQAVLDTRRAVLAPVFGSRVSRLVAACRGRGATAPRPQDPGPPAAQLEEEARRLCLSKGQWPYCKWRVEPRHRLLMCAPGKHGTNTWTSYFLALYGGEGGEGSVKRQVRALEGQAYTPREKESVVLGSSAPGGRYFSFLVCRNPLAKLRSVYRFSLYRSGVRGSSLPGFPPSLPPPSWEAWLGMLARREIRPGLDSPLSSSCQPCQHSWDAVVKMETFDTDSKAILR